MDGSRVRKINFSNRMCFEQGRLICIVGERAEGKGTLLRILGGAIFPRISEGTQLFIPSHLRVLHVSSEKLFFAGTLLENLKIGVGPGNVDGNPDRILNICKRLGIDDNVLSLLETDEVQLWQDVLSHTEAMLLCLARAFISNPELMIVHKPTSHFDRMHSTLILEMLREFVDKKGIGQAERQWYMRRLRTCILSGTKEISMQLSDQVYLVSKEEGIQRLDKSAVTAKMLE
eukprot:gnl/TRDRNA2_/TRDRNA2_176565_c3_seq2.p1 gnl/TRDRNA2_/TRDRNA2_176565_c3~~gnl/TRDRNA2_/TRDRNA2_176565_c3_seq2.p1  ORF type:complete len:231 (+),score=19.63 gnl/TRDRNA2_/TRDRNA2_176565_c3_seq2:3-695(+)